MCATPTRGLCGRFWPTPRTPAGVLRGDVPVKHLKLCLLDLMNWAIFWFRPDQEMSPERLSETFAVLFLEGARVSSADGEVVRGDRDGEASGA